MAPQQVRKLAFFPAAQQEPKLLLIGQFIHVTSLAFTKNVKWQKNSCCPSLFTTLAQVVYSVYSCYIINITDNILLSPKCEMTEAVHLS